MAKSQVVKVEKKRSNEIIDELDCPEFPENCFFVTCITRYRIPFFLVSMFRDVLIRGIEYFREKYEFKIYGFVIMPDHTHLVLNPNHKKYGFTISTVMRDIKAYSGREIARILGDKGKVWEPGFIKQELDSMEEFERCMQVMHEDPVKAGIIRTPEDYPYSSYRFHENGRESPILLTRIEKEVNRVGTQRESV